MSLKDEKPKRAGVIQFVYYPQDAEYIQKFMRDGFTMSALFRHWLRENGARAYPEPAIYAKVLLEKSEAAKKKMEDEERMKTLSNEEYARTVLLARVEGNTVWFRGSQGQDYSGPLSSVKEITFENNEVARVHHQIMTGKFAYVNGAPTEEQWAMLRKGFEDLVVDKK
jgi:hypothetical protein